MNTVVTINVGDKYSWEYTRNLFFGCKRNLSEDFSFVCFTDKAKAEEHKDSAAVDGYKVVAVPSDKWPINSWWWKVWLFSEECSDLLGGLIPDYKGLLWFDLDTVIVRSIDFLVGLNRFMILHDAYARNQWGSGIMYIPRGFCPDLWTHFVGMCIKSSLDSRENWSNRRGGDQVFIKQMHNQGIVKAGSRGSWCIQESFPGKVQSFKANKIRERPKKLDDSSLSVVFFHGRPRPVDVAKLKWMEANWRPGL